MCVRVRRVCALACALAKRLLCVCDRALSSQVVRKKKGELLRKEFIDTEASYVQNLDTIIKAPTTIIIFFDSNDAARTPPPAQAPKDHRSPVCRGVDNK